METFSKQLTISTPFRFKTEIITKEWDFEILSVHQLLICFCWRPQVGSPVSISISTENSNIKKCFFQMMSKYVLVSQGQIVFVNQSAVLTFTPSLAFYPKVYVVFFSLDSEQLASSQFSLFLNENFLNHVRLRMRENNGCVKFYL